LGINEEALTSGNDHWNGIVTMGNMKVDNAAETVCGSGGRIRLGGY